MPKDSRAALRFQRHACNRLALHFSTYRSNSSGAGPLVLGAYSSADAGNSSIVLDRSCPWRPPIESRCNMLQAFTRRSNDIRRFRQTRSCARMILYQSVKVSPFHRPERDGAIPVSFALLPRSPGSVLALANGIAWHPIQKYRPQNRSDDPGR